MKGESGYASSAKASASRNIIFHLMLQRTLSSLFLIRASISLLFTQVKAQPLLLISIDEHSSRKSQETTNLEFFCFPSFSQWYNILLKSPIHIQGRQLLLWTYFNCSRNNHLSWKFIDVWRKVILIICPLLKSLQFRSMYSPKLDSTSSESFSFYMTANPLQYLLS